MCRGRRRRVRFAGGTEKPGAPCPDHVPSARRIALLPTVFRSWPSLAELGQLRTDLDVTRLMSTNFGPKPGNFRQFCPNSDRARPNLDRFPPSSGRIRPTLAELGQIWNSLRRCRPNLGRSRPISENNGLHFGGGARARAPGGAPVCAYILRQVGTA